MESRSSAKAEMNIFVATFKSAKKKRRRKAVRRMNNDLISREALKKALHNFFDGKVIDEPTYILRDVLYG